MPSIRKRNDTYQITVSLGRDSHNKQILKTTTYKPKAKSPKAIEKEVNRFAIEFENEILNGKAVTSNITFKDYALKWLDDYGKSNLQERQQEDYLKLLERKAFPYIGHLKLNNITPSHLQEIFNDMEKEGKAPPTIHKIKTTISSVLGYAYKLGLINENPCNRCFLPPIKKKNKIQCFNLEQAQLFLNALTLEYPVVFKAHESHNGITKNVQQVKEYTTYKTIPLQFQAYFNLAIVSGMRKSEELALTWNDIDFETNTVHITKATTRTKKSGQFLKETKTEASYRDITIPSSTTLLLKAWREDQKNLFRDDGSRIGSQGHGEQFIFIQDNGKQMNIDTPLHKFRKIISDFNSLVEAKANEATTKEEKERLLSKKLPQIKLHDLRHTSATLLLSENTDIEVVSKRLGHARASVTLDIYGHALKEKDVSASNKLELMFNGKNGE